MEKRIINPEELDSLKRQLDQVRKASLLATREGNYMKMAKLTTQAARINKEIVQAEGLILMSEA
jgi:hypothetical protein